MKDDLLNEAKVEAARRHISLTALIEEALENALGKDDPKLEDLKNFRIITFKGSGVHRGINLDDSGSLLDEMGDVSL